MRFVNMQEEKRHILPVSWTRLRRERWRANGLLFSPISIWRSRRDQAHLKRSNFAFDPGC
mgnify:CR=1 FL=1|jgi:hypothetical protein